METKNDLNDTIDLVPKVEGEKLTRRLVSRVPLIFQTSRYLRELLAIVLVLFKGSKNGFRIFLSITKTSPGHFEVGGFTVVKSKN